MHDGGPGVRLGSGTHAITGYRPGFTMLDEAEPRTDPAADRAAGIARIDNRMGRPLLPSTAVLTEVVECLLEHGGAGAAGAVGPKGDKGDKGDPGPGLEAGLVRIRAISWLHAQPVKISELRNIVFPGNRRRFGSATTFERAMNGTPSRRAIDSRRSTCAMQSWICR